MLVPLDEAIDVAHLQPYAGLQVPAVVDAFEEMVEEALLQADTVVGVERRPVRVAVHFEPFLLRGRAQPAFEVAARMQALPAPVGCREQRDADLGQIGRALAVILVDERARQDVAPHVAAIALELLVAQRHRAAHELAGDAAFRAALAAPVLHGHHLHFLPVLAERAGDAAVTRAVAVEVRPPFPHAYRGEVRGLQRGGAPLASRVIRNAVQAHLAAAPRLRRRPFDAPMEIAVLARVIVIEVARRASCAARIEPHADVTVGYPFFGICDFPVLVLVGRAAHRIGKFASHDVPRGLVAVLEREPLAVRPVAHNGRVTARRHGPVDVGAQHDAVVHRDRHVPVDAHAVPHFAAILAHRFP